MTLSERLKTVFTPLWLRLPCAVAGLLAFTVYLLTAEDGVSFWDCPEYVTAALRLEIGHPPGNPLWMLTHRIIALFAPAGREAWMINVASGFFMATGTALLASVIMSVACMLWGRVLRVSAFARVTAAVTAAGGALSFGWCDSAWFSAVEAEVYAMSLFLTAFAVWLMTGWVSMRDSGSRRRRVVLIAYITGLSIGVHQLNLLCLPALALIWIYGHFRRPSPWRAWGALWWGCLLVGVLLLGMMPLTARWSGWMELFCVNRLGWPYGSGGALSVILLMSVAFLLPFLTKGWPRVSLLCWMGAMVLTGYLVWLLIPIRAMASPVMNQGDPSDPFAFASYLAREQYGSSPLFHGRTPFSRPLWREDMHVTAGGDTLWSYRDYIRRPKGTTYVPLTAGARVRDTFGLLAADGDTLPVPRGYVAAAKKYDLVYTPELDMFLPRITAPGADNLDAYAGWAGMTPESMEETAVSQTLDEAGNPAGKRDVQGVRHKGAAHRPTYFQNLRYMLAYQMGYMYFRYLLWNYCGRQNDIPSSGEVDHGNFITGIPFIDNAMLGPQELLPPEAGKENPGHHVYYLIPFIFGIWGCVVLARSGLTGRRILSVSAVLFLMTGLAIVFYLNQTPGEPRERDYSFLGSFWTFSFWIAMGLGGVAFNGAGGVVRKWRCVLAMTAGVAIPLWMLGENIPDHDRSGRRIPETMASNLLMPLEENAILVVQGDNFTFPVWYMQNVEGMRRDVVIVNQSYLSTPWYARQLSGPREDGGKPPAMVGRPEDFAYLQIPFAQLPDSVTEPMDGREALRRMYADTAHVARIPASRLTVGSGDERREIDLFATLGKAPGSKVMLSQIVMLDILISNESLENPRPVYWHRGVSSPALAGAARYGMTCGPVVKLEASGDTVGGLDRGMRAVDSMRGDYMQSGAWLDPYAALIVADQRQSILLTALELEEHGRGAEAVRMAVRALDFCDEQRWPFMATSRNGDILYPGLEIARILLTHGDDIRKERGAALLRSEHERMEAWMTYYSALPAWRREAVSPRSRNLAAGLTRARELSDKFR
ncbi:MAG: DUF2723 domain-containing protein [Muribaculaceae bacterium]|nr:DUF2723 domain-containing protein [Muribaculaceae bacterium]